MLRLGGGAVKKILIVEDDESIAELERDYLEMNKYIVEISANGVDALRMINSGVYDLVILDIMLPGIDGFEILRQINEELLIPILLVSAKKEEFEKIRGFRLGASDYITKPFSPGELVARVNAHLLKIERIKSKFKDEQVATNIQIRGLEIQKDSRRVFVNNNEIAITQKEFDLLLFLAQNPNKVFGRDELFDRVWGFDSLGESATVTVHIGRIREKIETDLSNPQYIETVWGAGYRFRV
jgi:two-component system, OmpR family, response regulator